MSRRILLLAILCLAACLLAAGCTSRTVYTESGGITPAPTPSPDLTIRYSAPPTATVIPQKAALEEDQLEILDHDIEYQRYMVYVTGTAKNTGSERISHGSIKVKFYDADGNLVGNGMDMVSDLDAGETWKFKATAFDTDGEIESYKIGVGSSW
jgi:hypothetical protein